MNSRNPRATETASLAVVNPWLLLLRLALFLDALVLGAVGMALVLTPHSALDSFGFGGMPPGTHYFLGLWGCALISLGLGYVVAAGNPLRHVVWIRAGVIRGVLECAVAGWYLMRGTVTWHQGWLGLTLAALVTLVYIALYPRRRRDVRAVPKDADSV